VKGLLINKRFGILLLAAVLGALLYQYGLRSITTTAEPGTGQAVAAAQGPATVTVSGRGEVRVPPDSARVNLGVVTWAKSAREAQAANNRTVSAVVAALKAQGIPREGIQTSEFNIWPQTDEKGKSVTGYQVNHILTVQVGDVDKLGAVLDAAVAAGANHSYGISFEKADRAALEREALKKAVAEAQARAEVLAGAAGKKIVRVLSVKEAGTQPDIPIYRKMAFEVGGQGVPVEPGQLTVSAAVEVVFEISG